MRENFYVGSNAPRFATPAARRLQRQGQSGRGAPDASHPVVLEHTRRPGFTPVGPCPGPPCREPTSPLEDSTPHSFMPPASCAAVNRCACVVHRCPLVLRFQVAGLRCLKRALGALRLGARRAQEMREHERTHEGRVRRVHDGAHSRATGRPAQLGEGGRRAQALVERSGALWVNGSLRCAMADVRRFAGG